MKNISERCSARVLALAGASALALLAVAQGAAAAPDKKLSLRIERDGKGTVIQAIPVASWNFDAARGVLQVTSTDGNRRCDGATAAAGAQTLLLDGRVYGIERIPRPRSVDTTITVRPAGDGVFPLCTAPPGPVVAERTVSKGLTGLNLELDVIAAGNEVSRVVAVDDRISYQPGSPPRIVTTIPQTLLCSERPGASGGRLTVTDANGLTSTLAGVDAVDFIPSSRVLALDLSPGLTCFAPTDDPVFSLPAPLSPADPAACETVIDTGNRIFADGFEVEPPVGGDTPGTLEFDLRLIRAPSLDEPESLVYEYVVQNCGTTALAGVTVREFWPGSGGSAPVRLEQDSAWDVCGSSAGGCSDPVAGNTGYIDTTLGSLAPKGQQGSRVIIRAERPLDAGAAGLRARIDAVAIVNDGSKAPPAHVLGSWGIQVLQSGNDSPVLGVSSGSLPTAQNPFSISEDSGTVALTGTGSGRFRLRAEDADSGFNCGSGCLSVTSSAPGIIAASDVAASFVPQPNANTGRLDLSVTPKQNAFGRVTLSIAAVDIEGGVSNPVTVVIDVEPENDPPTFRIGAGGVYPPGGKSATQTRSVDITPSAFCDLFQATPSGEFVLADPDCPTHTWDRNPSFPDNVLQYTSWVTDVQPGPGETGNVNLVVSIADNSDGVLGQVAFDRATGQLSYQLSGSRGLATIRVRAEDDEGLFTRVFVSIVVANSPPTVVAPGPLSIDESFEGVVTTLSATDSDGDDITDWRIVSGNPGGAFGINASGVLRVNNAGPIDFEGLPEGARHIDLLVAATDGISEGEATVRVGITDADDEAPVLSASSSRFVALDRGTTAQLTPAILEASDSDSPLFQIRFVVTVLDLPDSELLVDGEPIGVGGIVRQNDINNGLISIRSLADGSRSFGGVTFRLQDVAGNVNPNPVSLAVNVQ